MSDEHDQLSHLAEMIPPPDDGFGRLHDRRDRQRRTRRLTAGVVGVTLTAAVVVGAWQVSRNTAIGPADGETPLPTAADVGRIACNTDGATVETPHVVAQPDGVHLVLENNGTPALYQLEFAGTAVGDRAELPETQITNPDIPPGTVGITCYDESADPSAGGVATATFTVVDPEDRWVETALSCPEAEASHAVYDPMPGLKGLDGDPVDIARDELDVYLRDGDVVERAGYPEAADRLVVRAVRDERVLATVNLYSVIEGGWLINTVNTCNEFTG